VNDKPFSIVEPETSRVFIFCDTLWAMTQPAFKHPSVTLGQMSLDSEERAGEDCVIVVLDSDSAVDAAKVFSEHALHQAQGGDN
jgi:hypothetical protein